MGVYARGCYAQPGAPTSNPNAIEGYVVKKGRSTTDDNKTVWHVRNGGANYDAATCVEHGVVVSGVAPAFLLVSGSMRDPLLCGAHAQTTIASAYAYYKEKVLSKRPGQVERLRVTRFFDPLFEKNASIDTTGIDEIVAVFRLFEHRDFRNDPAGWKTSSPITSRRSG